jgi:hypothetical protein
MKLLWHLRTLVVLVVVGAALRAAPQSLNPDVPFSCPVAFDGSIDKSVAKLGPLLALTRPQQEQLRDAMQARAKSVGQGIAGAGKNFVISVRSALTAEQFKKIDSRTLARANIEDLAKALGDLTVAERTQLEASAEVRRKETWTSIVTAQQAYEATLASFLRPEQQRQLAEIEARDPVLHIPNR